MKTENNMESIILKMKTIRNRMLVKDNEFYVKYAEFCDVLKNVPAKYYKKCMFSLDYNAIGNVVFSKPRIQNSHNMFMTITMEMNEEKKGKSKRLSVASYPEDDDLGMTKERTIRECVINITGEVESAYLQEQANKERQKALNDIKKYL